MAAKSKIHSHLYYIHWQLFIKIKNGEKLQTSGWAEKSSKIQKACLWIILLVDDHLYRCQHSLKNKRTFWEGSMCYTLVSCGEYLLLINLVGLHYYCYYYFTNHSGKKLAIYSSFKLTTHVLNSNYKYKSLYWKHLNYDL